MGCAHDVLMACIHNEKLMGLSFTNGIYCGIWLFYCGCKMIGCGAEFWRWRSQLMEIHMGCKQQGWACDENPYDKPTLWFFWVSLGIVVLSNA